MLFGIYSQLHHLLLYLSTLSLLTMCFQATHQKIKHWQTSCLNFIVVARTTPCAPKRRKQLNRIGSYGGRSRYGNSRATTTTILFIFFRAKWEKKIESTLFNVRSLIWPPFYQERVTPFDLTQCGERFLEDDDDDNNDNVAVSTATWPTTSRWWQGKQ